jgi:prophage regulatory protein
LNEYELVNNYLVQLSNRAASTIIELELLQKHIDGFKNTLLSKCKVSRSEPEKIAIEPIFNKIELDACHPNDLIRIKEVIKMIGLSRSSIYSCINNGTFPRPIKLSSRSVVWQRGMIEIWILDKVNSG